MTDKKEKQTSALLASLIIFFKGILMGSADIIPGVSGGTIALITGIYTRLIEGINGVYDIIRGKSLKLIAGLRFKLLWKKIKSLDFALFIPLFAGIALAFLSLAHLIEFVMTEYTVATYSFFFGLIIASAIFLYKQIEGFSPKRIIALIIGIVIGVLITSMQTLAANHSLPIIFISGAIAITAMILPGISGSFMLVMLNQYEHVISAIKSLDISIIAVFGLGAFIGLMVFSKFLTFMLHKHRNGTFSFLVGLMLGSLRLQYGIIAEAGVNTSNIVSLILFGILGCVLVFVLERFAPVKKETVSK